MWATTVQRHIHIQISTILAQCAISIPPETARKPSGMEIDHWVKMGSRFKLAPIKKSRKLCIKKNNIT